MRTLYYFITTSLTSYYCDTDEKRKVRKKKLKNGIFFRILLWYVHFSPPNFSNETSISDIYKFALPSVSERSTFAILPSALAPALSSANTAATARSCAFMFL